MAVDVKIAVTGPHGRLGSELVRRGCMPIEASVTDFMALSKAFMGIDPDVIIHCAAMTDVDMCEGAPIHAAEINMGGTYGLAEMFPGRIVYISTDYIFDGREGPYGETATPNPLNVYGWTKLGGEIVLRNRGDERDLIVRTTVLFDKYSDNFVTNVARKLLQGATVALPSGLLGSPTYVPHLADGILAAIEKGISGVVNLAGWRAMSRWEFGMCIAAMLETDGVVAYGPVNGRAPRPRNAGLRVDKARSLGLPIGDPLDGLKEVTHALEAMETG